MIIQQLSLFETEPTETTGKESNENYTPIDLIELVHSFYGYPELDPFTCRLANQIIKAQKIFTIQDDGFTQDWRGYQTIWLNPPYSAGFLEPVVDKLIELLIESPEVFLLTNTDNSTQWYKKALMSCDRFILPTKRLTFYSPKRAAEGKKQSGNDKPQTLFYFGQQPQKVEEVFVGWGVVCQTSKW